MAVHTRLPEVGDIAPAFEAETTRGKIRFPEYAQGSWCILFSHPVNFSCGWRMYSTFLALKERRFNDRNTKLLGLSNEPFRFDERSDRDRKERHNILRAPVIEDPHFELSNQWGMDAVRRRKTGFDRLAFIIDPQGVIRLILHNPLPSIVHAVLDLERELHRLQTEAPPLEIESPDLSKIPNIEEYSDATDCYKPKPAYFQRHKLNLN